MTDEQPDYVDFDLEEETGKNNEQQGTSNIG